MFLQFVKDIRYVQYMSAVIASLGSVCMGASFSWSSPSIPLLTSKDSPIGVQLTHAEASWVASSFPLGMIPGSLIGGMLLYKVGHKHTFIYCGLLFVVSWILVGLSGSLALLVSALILGGLGGGAQLATVQLYIGEIADTDIRGRLAVLPTAFALGGLLIGLGLGPFVPYKVYAFLSASLALLFTVGSLFIPQSPYFLIKKGRENEAQSNLNTLASTLKNRNKEKASLQEIRDTIEYQTNNNFTLKRLLTESRYRKSLMIVTVLKTLSDFSGGYALSSYVQTVLQESEADLSPNLASLIYGVVQMVSAFSSAMLIDRLGRKFLSIVSFSGSAFALTIEGLYFYLKDVEHIDMSKFDFLPILALCVYRLMASLSLSSLPYVLVSELFSVDAKDVCAVIFSVYASVLIFTNVKIFNPIVEAAGFHTLFWMFAISSALAVVFIAVFLPETKGKSFNAIQNKLHSNL